MAKAAQSLVLMLTNLDYSSFTLEETERLTTYLHHVINVLERRQTNPPPVSTTEKALREIVSLYPDPGICAELVPKFVGPNDGQMRASHLWYALNAARKALGLSTYPEPEHWNKGAA